MDHGYIQEQQIVSRYAMGRLDSADRIEFEDHLIDCPQCLDELELSDDFRRTLRIVVSQRESRINTRFRARESAMFAVAALIVVGLISFFLLGQSRRFQQELEQARLDSSAWERRYNDELQARTNAESQLRESSAAAAPIFPLSLTRSVNLANAAPSTSISIPREARSIVLSLELQNDPDFRSHRATLTDSAGNRVWGVDRMVSTSSGALALILPANVIHADKYVLTVEGERAGQYSVIGTYIFRASISN
jgi:hypothetical protein